MINLMISILSWKRVLKGMPLKEINTTGNQT